MAGKIQDLQNKIKSTLTSCYKSFQDKSGKTVEYYIPFTEKDIRDIDTSLQSLLDDLGGIISTKSVTDDCPIPFDAAALADYMQELSIQENISQFTDFLVLRVRTMLSDNKIKNIMGTGNEICLADWLNSYIGTTASGQITIIDLSLIPSEILHIVTSVISRIVFEALQRYRKIQADHSVLPTVIVMEEAHSFIRRYKSDSENQDAATVCCKVRVLHR